MRRIRIPWLPAAIMVFPARLVASVIFASFIGGCLSHRSNGEVSRAARFLALGDSYTIGEGVSPADRWPMQLAELLRRDSHAIAEPEIIARTGWTTDELDAAITVAHPSGTYDLVSLLIGVNNQYRGRPLENYREEFAALLERAIQFAGDKPSHVIVLSIPDWGVTPFARLNGRDPERVAAEIDELNHVAEEITTRRGAIFIDVTESSRAAASDGGLLTEDGLHPSAAAYREWAALAHPAALKVLSND